MHHPQIVVYERDSRLADALRSLADAERWVVREPRQADPLWRLLQTGGPTVLVVKFGSSPDRDLALIEGVSRQLPDVATVAVGDLEGAAVLAGLAWDVGAAFALFPPQSRDLLPEIVAGLMRRAIRDTVAPVPAGAEVSP
jgi:hypothetical protein